MAFLIKAGKLPTLRSHAACEAWARERAVKITKRTRPIWGPDCIPLYKTRTEHLRLERKSDRWALMLYSTEVVGHYLDGTTLLDCGFNSVSARTFLRHMSNYEVKSTAHGHAYVINGKYHKVREKPIIVNPQHVVVNPEDWDGVKIVSNREQRKLIKERLRPFLTWYDAMTSIANNVRGVVGDAKTEKQGALPQRFVCDQDAWQEMLIKIIVDNDAGNEDEWRAACWSMLGKLSYYWMRSHILDSPSKVKDVRKAFINKAYQNHDGYKTVRFTVPAGEKP